MIRAITATVLALGLAGPVLADHGHDRGDRQERAHRDWRNDRHDRYERDHSYDHRDRHYAAPRYQSRWRAAPPRGWYPGWRESYGRGYRYWNDGYYYAVPAPGFGLSVTIPLR
jgi:hypothetical protein